MDVAKDRIDADTLVSTTELACVLGVTGRRIRQMVEDGQLAKESQGRFKLCDAVRQYIEFRDRQKKDDDALDMEKLEEEVRLKRAKATMAQLEVEELQGKMHRSEDVAAMTEDLIYAIRGALLALPGRLAMDVAAVNTPAEAAQLIRKELFTVMDDLANYKYDPAKYEERVRERLNWETEHGPDEAEDQD